MAKDVKKYDILIWIFLIIYVICAIIRIIFDIF